MSVSHLSLTTLLAFFSMATHGAVSKAQQILIDRGLQVHGMVLAYSPFNLATYSNANYTTVNWTWDSPPSSDSMSVLGAAPGFPWARWVTDETNMPPQGGEAPYVSQLVLLQLGDEWNLDDTNVRTRAINWFNSISNNWPNTILSANNGGGQIAQSSLTNFVERAHPDMIFFDTYPWRNEWTSSTSNHIGAVISGPPTAFYSELRIYRDIARSFNIPFGIYVQTFNSVQDYDTTVFRDPSPSELRLNMFSALAFNSKALTDFLYNNGSSSLFIPGNGDGNPTPLYYEKADAALRARNFGKALVRLQPIEEATTNWTTSVMFIRGKNTNGTLNTLPLNFHVAGASSPNTDWVSQRNDPYLVDWSVTNKAGIKNNGYLGDVIISWFKPLDESFDGPDYTNEIYIMVVNGLSDPTGSATDCLQEIKLNFNSSLAAVEMLNPLTGITELQTLPLTNGSRQLVLNLNGGDAALFKFPDGAPFVGAALTPLTGLPVMTIQPANRTNVFGTDATFTARAAGSAPLSYQWQFNEVNISGATTNNYTRTNTQAADVGNYSVVVSNSSGSITSTIATLTLVSSLPIFYEPFDYTNIGGPVSSNTPGNWTPGGTGTNDLNVTGGNLYYPGLVLPIGNSVTNGGAGLGMRRLFGTNINNGIVYVSALFKINDLGYGNWNGLASQVGALTAPDSSSFRLQMMVKSNSPSGYVIGVQKGGSGSTATFGTTEYHAGDTIFLVGKYDFTTSSNAVSLWINPSPATLSSASPPMTGFLLATNGPDGFTIDRFNFRQNLASGANSVPAAMQWDELRIGSSWAAVTPPAPIRFSLFNLLPDRRLQLQATAGAASAAVETSSNLVNWLELTNLTSTNGIFEYFDFVTNEPQRFYRLRISP